MTKATTLDPATSQQSASENAPPDGAVTADLLAQLTDILWLPHDMDETERGARMAAARAMLADINPADGIEGMLACQMVAAHEAAMACLGRSMAPDQSPGQTDQDLRHAERLMALYTRQVDVLGRHRIREEERRKLLEQQRRDAERLAWLESIEAPPGAAFESLLAHLTENDPGRDDQHDDGFPADVHIGGADGQGESDGRRDAGPAEP